MKSSYPDPWVEFVYFGNHSFSFKNKSFYRNQWRIHGERQGCMLPSRSKFFHFHAVFGKNNRLAHSSQELGPSDKS